MQTLPPARLLIRQPAWLSVRTSASLPAGLPARRADEQTDEQSFFELPFFPFLFSLLSLLLLYLAFSRFFVREDDALRNCRHVLGARRELAATLHASRFRWVSKH